MISQQDERETSLTVLRDSSKHGRATLLAALYTIRYNVGIGDEDIIIPLLEHSDDGVAASALFTLWHSFAYKEQLELLIMHLAYGDPRDVGDMPIQTMAITLLSELAKQNKTALRELEAIAENSNTHICPRKSAWQHLAELYKADWKDSYTDEMIMSPDSEQSEQIRQVIRDAKQKL